MSYHKRQVPLRGTNGLGASYTIDVPCLGSHKLNIPVEQAANDAVNLAMGTLKNGMNQAAGMAVGELKKQMPVIAGAAVGELQKQTPKIVGTLMPVLEKQVLPPLLKQVQDVAVNELWPKMQPKVREEVIFAGLVLAGALILPLAGATLYLRREIRRSKG